MTAQFSDEFNKDGRTFYPGDDPYFTAVDLWYGVTQDMEVGYDFQKSSSQRAYKTQVVRSGCRFNKEWRTRASLRCIPESWAKLSFGHVTILEPIVLYGWYPGGFNIIAWEGRRFWVLARILGYGQLGKTWLCRHHGWDVAIQL